MNFAANALLAIGASPLMSFFSEEMGDLADISSALVVNIGCLDSFQISSMRAAVAAAARKGHPWVLDPAGAGASRVRTRVCLELAAMHPSVIRGNASEIACLAGGNIVNPRGVDSSVSSDETVSGACRLALATGSVVSMSGAVDYITDGHEVERVSLGDPIMPRVTAMGCTASAITGAFLAVDDDPLNAALRAMELMGTAGSEAASMSGGGTGTFACRFLDCLSRFGNGQE